MKTKGEKKRKHSTTSASADDETSSDTEGVKKKQKKASKKKAKKDNRRKRQDLLEDEAEAKEKGKGLKCEKSEEPSQPEGQTGKQLGEYQERAEAEAEGAVPAT